MMKKYIKRISALVLAGFALTSCTDEVQLGGSFLDKAPGGTANLDSIFTNPDYINQFLTGIYAQQYYGLPYNHNRQNSADTYSGKLDGLTDLYQMHWASARVWRDYYMGTLTSTSDPLISFSKDRVWETVHQCCLIKENIDKCTTMSQEKKDYIVAQATALQAFAYSVLLPHYGGLPIINKTITGTDEEVGPRATIEETVNFIVSLCDEAKEHLYWAYNGNDTETNSTQTGRWTKAGVMALKAQVLWLAASPLFNDVNGYYGGSTEAETKHLVWYGNYDPARWERALAAFEDFWKENEKNGNYYHLLMPEKKTSDGYRVAYRRGYIMDDSPENIHYTKVAENWGSQGTYSWQAWNGNGYSATMRLTHYPTVEYVEMFPWSDGSPFETGTVDADGKRIDSEMKYKETLDLPDGTKSHVYTCLSGQYDKLFWKWTITSRTTKKEANRDPRLYENAIVSGTPKTLDFSSMDGSSNSTKFDTNIWETWVAGNDAGFCVKNADGTINEQLTSFCPTGFGVYKYVLSEPEYHRNYNMHWNVLTIPDMILMYAECLAECGHNDQAIAEVDKIRARVGMKSINSSFNKSLDLLNNKDNLIEEILRERACELGMTNARYIDMVRRKRTDWMVKPLHGMATYRMNQDPATKKWVRRNAPWFGDDKNAEIFQPTRFEYEFFELIQGKRVLWGKDKNSQEVLKWLMMPFPQDEVNKGYGIVQNPGW